MKRESVDKKTKLFAWQRIARKSRKNNIDDESCEWKSLLDEIQIICDFIALISFGICHTIMSRSIFITISHQRIIVPVVDRPWMLKNRNKLAPFAYISHATTWLLIISAFRTVDIAIHSHTTFRSIESALISLVVLLWLHLELKIDEHRDMFQLRHNLFIITISSSCSWKSEVDRKADESGEKLSPLSSGSGSTALWSELTHREHRQGDWLSCFSQLLWTFSSLTISKYGWQSFMQIITSHRQTKERLH